MNRKKFIKRMLTISAAVFVAPRVLGEVLGNTKDIPGSDDWTAIANKTSEKCPTPTGLREIAGSDGTMFYKPPKWATKYQIIHPIEGSEFYDLKNNISFIYKNGEWCND